MDRRSFLTGAATATAALACFPAMAAIAPGPVARVHPHERLGDVWAIMRRTPGGPAAMRAAVEKEFGAGILRFEGECNGSWTVVLLDTATADFYRFAGDPPEYASTDRASMRCRIVSPGKLDHDWDNGPPIIVT